MSKLQIWAVSVVGLLTMGSVLGCASQAEPTASMNLTVRSPAFAANSRIPLQFTSQGGDSMSPPLRWSQGPPGTRSFAIIVDDPDASNAPFIHWIVFNIPPAVTGLDPGKLPSACASAVNDSGSSAYYGPNPPSGVHHYHFKVFALDENLPLSSGASKGDVLKAMAGHTLGEGDLVAIYGH